jgi:hypothetical protein
MISQASNNGKRQTETVLPEEESRRETEKPFHPLGQLLGDMAALAAFCEHYLAARRDALRARVRRWALMFVAGIIAAVAGATAIVAATVLALEGIARGIAAATGSLWIGQLITGFGVLLVIGLAVAAGAAYFLRTSSRQTKEKYERRRKQQHAAFGRGVGQRSEASA